MTMFRRATACAAPQSVGPNAWRFAEFFAGIGLMRIGLERADPRWRCVFANDLDSAKREMYATHFGAAGEVDGRDVHQLPASAIPDVDLATASFPCTDLSIAGSQQGIRAGQSAAFWGFRRVLDELGPRRPPLVLLENVLGFLSSNDGRDFVEVTRSLNDSGYSVDAIVLDARWFVPQSRPRLFVTCVKREWVAPDRLQPLAPSRTRPAKLVELLSANVGRIESHCLRLPDPPEAARRSLEDVVRDPPPGHRDWWSEARVVYLLDQMFERHRAWIEQRRGASRLHYATAFRRVRLHPDGRKRSTAELRTDGIAGCLRTPKGGSGRQILVRVGRGRVDVRLVSPQECASLMGADGYTIATTVNRALLGFGDAVCVDAVTWIARRYLAPLMETSAARRRESTKGTAAPI